MHLAFDWFLKSFCRGSFEDHEEKIANLFKSESRRRISSAFSPRPNTTWPCAMPHFLPHLITKSINFAFKNCSKLIKSHLQINFSSIKNLLYTFYITQHQIYLYYICYCKQFNLKCRSFEVLHFPNACLNNCASKPLHCNKKLIYSNWYMLHVHTISIK